MNKPFKNRITQEDDITIRHLKSTYINMNEDKKRTPDTPDGAFLISIQPDRYVDEVKLEADFKFILCLYYHWRYGSKWTSLKHLQQNFAGIVERQESFYHLHFLTYTDNMEELAIFCGYMKGQFKHLYPRTSFDVQAVYDINGAREYISIDNPRKKRTSVAIPITDKMYQVKINERSGT